MKLRIELPWPDKALSPNGRVHWARKAKAVAKHRGFAKLAAIAAIRSAKWPSGVREAYAKTRFIDPSTRRRDRDNHASMCKSYFDGLADAGVVANDCGFVHWPVTFEVGPVRCVVIEIEPVSEARRA
jgi:crossover junction endodeoxyribonuclease RusA